MESAAISPGASRSVMWSCWLIPGIPPGRGEPAPAEAHLVACGVVAVRDARDLGGPAEDALVRRLQPAPGRRAGRGRSARDRGPFQHPRRRGRPRGARSACWSSWRPFRRDGRRSGSTARGRIAGAASECRNVVLIVWDTVRAANLSLYGYPRDTTPNLMRWARKGVRYSLALRRPRGRIPSHSCFFTGKWPIQLNSSGSTRSTPRTRPWRNTWPHAVIRPPDSRRTPSAAVTSPGWIVDSPISRIIR